LVKTLYTGITNGTERNMLIRGNYAPPDERLPASFGYQNVGRVIQVGPDARLLNVGDVVFSGHDHTEFVRFDEDWLCIKLPENVQLPHAAMFGMGAVAMRTCRNADIRLGERVLVVGAGVIGQFAAQIAATMGAQVDICDVQADRLKVAETIGAMRRAVDVSGPDGFKKQILDPIETDPQLAYDVVLDLAGVSGMENPMMSACKWRGRLLFIAGRFDVHYEFNNGQGHEITIKQNSHFDREDLRLLCEIVAAGRVQVGPLIKEQVKVQDAAPIYDRLRDDPSSLLGTVFDWQ